MLPMQRITRLPLLVDAVVSRLKPDDDEFASWKLTLAILNKIVGQCNDAANRSAQSYEMEVLSRQIEFPQHIRPLAILPVGITGNVPVRSLVRRDELTHLIWRGDDGGSKLTFGKKFTKTAVYLFLFTDLLVLAKRRGGNDESFVVFDYCARSMLTVSSGEVIPQLPTKDLPLAGKHLICLTLLENHDGKMVEMVINILLLIFFSHILLIRIVRRSYRVQRKQIVSDGCTPWNHQRRRIRTKNSTNNGIVRR